MGRTLFVLHSALTPNAVVDALPVQLTKNVGRYFPCLATEAIAYCWARLARIHSDCRSANITAMTSLGNSMLDLCLSRGEPESRVTSMLSVGRNTSCVFGSASLC